MCAMVGLGARLERLARRSDPRRLARDPLGVVRASQDREGAALLPACLAFGNARSIRVAAARAIEAWEGGGGPPRGFRYRWIGEGDLARLFGSLREARARHGSLEMAFLRHDRPESADVGAGLDGFSSELRGRRPTPGLRFLLPRPRDGSACKRSLLFLRWVARPDDGADLGLWSGLSPRRLVVPLDTHVHRIAYWLGLTGRKAPSWRAALEVTAALRRFDPLDPVRYDFALAHLGISGDCPRSPVATLCAPCPLRPHCRAWT